MRNNRLMFDPARWTINRISGVGCAAALPALLLWLLYPEWPDLVGWPFILLLAIAAGSGMATLTLTVRDIYNRSGRGSRLRPIRTFDLILGLTLAVPSLVELAAILPERVSVLGL